MTDDTEQAFRDALHAHATEAPVPTALARTARLRVARRRRGGVAGVVVGALAVIGGVLTVGDANTAAPDGPVPTIAAEPDGPDEPDVVPTESWRWESYGGVELQVPGDWTAEGQGCVEGQLPRAMMNGFVSRPYGDIMCGHEPGVLPTSVTLPYVSFGGFTEGPDRSVRVEGNVATQVLGGVMLSVKAPDELRERILASVRQVDVDVNGCPTTDPISKDPALEPEPAQDVSTLTGVETLSACRYALDGPGSPPGPDRLLSSLRLTGETATDVVAAIGTGEVGGGPNRPQNCPPGWVGGEALVLLIESDSGSSRVHGFYDSCVGHGFDDGVRLYALTADALGPLLSGPNTHLGALLYVVPVQ